MKKIIKLTESDLVRIVKKVISEQSKPQEDCSKLKKIPKGGLKDGGEGGGKPQSTTWVEDIKKIGNAGTLYIFEGPLFDAMNTQKKCHRAKIDVNYAEFKRNDGTYYTYIGID